MLIVKARKSKKLTISFDYFKTLMTAGKYKLRHTFYPSGNEGTKEPVSIAAGFTII